MKERTRKTSQIQLNRQIKQRKLNSKKFKNTNKIKEVKI